LGKSEYDAAFSLVQQILQHLLLIEHSPVTDQRLRWSDEIDGLRNRLECKLSSTVRRRLKREFEEAFARASARAPQAGALWRAAGGCHVAAECPYSLEQVFGDWLPGEGAVNPA
jgi:Domain of unknown function DUF29